MVPTSRRTLLAALAGSLPLGLAGCLGETGPVGESSTDGTGPSPNGDDSSTGDGVTADTTTEPRGPPDVDCDAASRPPAAAIRDGETPSPASQYPDPPDDPTDTSAVADYLTAHERAYVRNGLAATYGDRLETVGVSMHETQSFPAPPGATVVRVRYAFYYNYRDDPETTATIAADSPTTYATYYLDDSLLVRAEHAGRLSDESVLLPDPWTDGEAVACFE